MNKKKLQTPAIYRSYKNIRGCMFSFMEYANAAFEEGGNDKLLDLMFAAEIQRVAIMAGILARGRKRLNKLIARRNKSKSDAGHK